MNHLPPRERVRADRIIEGDVFFGSEFKEFLQMRLMDLYPNQPDLMWDHPILWSHFTRRRYLIFRQIRVDGEWDRSWASWLEGWRQNENLIDQLGDEQIHDE